MLVQLPPSRLNSDWNSATVASAAIADVALLVVDATADVAAVDALTREYVSLVRLLGIARVVRCHRSLLGSAFNGPLCVGVTQIVVAVTKMDEAGWAEKRFTNTVTQLASGFLKQCGFAPKSVGSVAVSGTTGAHVMLSVDPRICEWNKGPTLVQLLDKFVVSNEHQPPMVSRCLARRPFELLVT